MARAFLAVMITLALVLGLGWSEARANPFTGKPAAPESDALAGEPPAAASGPPAQVERAWGPIAVVGRALLTFQREANRLIATHMRAIRDGETSLPLLIGAGLAFLYGVVHTLGPGHGKLVVMSYFLSREAQIGRGLLMGVQIAVFHVISAMIVVALADFVLRQAFGGQPAEVAGVRLASYGLIALIGMAMTGQALRRSYLRRHGVAVSHACCGHGRERAADDRAPAGEGRGIEQGALSLGVGLVPCTGAVLILLYAMANDILFAGMLLVAAIAAGMAITMGALGIVSVVARRTVARRVQAGGNGQGRLTVAMDYAGALAITALGGALFWAAL
jgi:ABC-type nickel/cobalt efflux system permease component RcnA